MSIPFTVLGGYLGAGKTTLINHLLGNAGGQRLALIINDFGAINIDADLISEQTEDQINLTNGCICCGMSAGFDEALEALLARAPLPDRIVVEASGVADVISLAQYGHHPGLHLDGIIVLADAETVRAKARDKYVDRTVLRQLRGADLIVLNKTDLVTPEALEDLKDWLAGISPGVPVLPASHGRIPLDAFFGAIRNRDGTGADEAPHGGHEEYVTWQFEHAGSLSQVQVEAFLAALPAGVLRGKGFFQVTDGKNAQTLLYQQVGQRRSLQSYNDTGSTRIVMIGLAAELDPAALAALAARYLR